MGYALFAQRKVQLTGNVNSVSLQQTQRSNEQYILSTNTLSLQQQMSSLQTAQSLELADLYELLAATTEENGVSVDDDDTEKKSRLEEIAQQNGFTDLSTITRDQINDKIKAKQAVFDAELDDINREIYVVSTKESAVEMDVKRLDTQLSSLQKQLEAVEEAEGSAIERATPKFSGVG